MSYSLNILYTINDGFAPQCATGIVSICENNKEADDINFFIVSLALSDKNCLNLKKTAASYGRNIFIHIINNLSDYVGDFDTGGWNETVLLRLLLGECLPPEVDRVLYLDGDTIVRGSLQKLWQTNFTDKEIIGAVIEPTVDRERLKSISLDKCSYFNAGVLLVNVIRWKKFGAQKKLLNCLKTYKKLLFANDQDAINIVFKDRIKPLSPAYNFFNIYDYYPYNVLKKLTSGTPFYTEAQVANAIKNPIIIHFLGEDRPWRKGNTHAYSHDYQAYLNKTIYADAPQEEGWEAYYLAFKAFNMLMAPFPMLRYKIINGLIPLFLSLRKKKRTKSSK